MKAFIVDRYKKKGALRFGEMPEPEPGDNDVLVEIHAAGVNMLRHLLLTRRQMLSKRAD